MPRRSLPLLWVSAVSVVVGITACAIFLVLQFSRGDLDRGDKLASIISMSVTVLTLPLSVYALVLSVRQGQPTKTVVNLADHLDSMAEALAISVRSQWEAEEQIRRVHDPFPLPTRWTNAPENLMDHWQNINGSPDRPDPIVLDGRGDHAVETFNRIPSGRLVVLGQAGAGKTILTSRFVLTLLANRSPASGMPVPVIFSLGSWDPSVMSLRDWQAKQLIATYPMLAEQDSTGSTLAVQLLATGRIMPVLDGLDEVSEGLRGDAIDRINAGLRPGDRLLLTSRPEEYAAAVRAGDVITAAAVVRLEHLTIADLTGYLPLTVRRTDDRDKWSRVLEEMRANQAPALTEVLSTPLLVALARAIFSDTGADPEELLGVGSAAGLEDRLFTGFVPAIYPRVRQHDQRFGAEDAERWFKFLAGHLRGLSTYDLAWWQLVRSVPRAVVGLVAGLVIALMTLLGAGLLGWFGHWPSANERAAWLTTSLVFCLTGGIAGGLIVGWARGIHPSPARLRLKIRGRIGQILRELYAGFLRRGPIVWLLVWAAGGTMFGFAATRVTTGADGTLVGLGAGVLSGFGTWFVATFVRALGVPVSPTETVSPAELMRTDRRTALRQGLLVGVGGSTVLWLAIWMAFEPAFGSPFGHVFGNIWVIDWLVLVAAGALIWVLFVTVWGPWLIARFWLPLTGRLPWSVMTFLDDAHRRGVLRQAGGVYQFRHARLQDHFDRTR